MHVDRRKLCIAVGFLEGLGPKQEVEHKQVANYLQKTAALMHISRDNIFNVYMDEGSVMVATANNVLRDIWDKTTFYLCWPHKIHGIGEKMKEDEEFHGP